MNKVKYLNDRKALADKAQSFIDANDMENFNKTTKEIENLDNAWDKAAKAQANLDALNSNAPINIANQAVNIHGEVVDSMGGNAPNVIDSNEYREAWLKNLQGKELTGEEQKVLKNAASFSVIPKITLDKIFSKPDNAPIYNAVDVLAIPGAVTLPVETANADASWATTSTDSSDKIANVDLTAYQLIKTVEIKADVKAMAIDAFEEYLVQRLRDKIFKAADNAILNGTGSSQPTGLLKSGEITNVGTYTKTGMTYDDLLAIISALPEDYDGTASFCMKKSVFFQQVYGIKDANGKPVVVTDVQSPAKYILLGYPVILDGNMPADTIILGDFKAYLFNWAQDIEVKSDESVGFRSGSTVYRAIALADGKKKTADAFVCYTKATA